MLKKRCCCCIKQSYYLVQLLNVQKSLVQEPCLLKDLEYKCYIFNNVLNVTLNQTFQSQSQQQYTDAEYFIPVDDYVCLESFEAKYNGKTVKGLVTEKEAAKKEYKENKQQGNLVSYASIENKTKSDQVVIKLGNIPPQEQIEIQIKFSQQLNMILNKYYTAFIPIQHFEEIISAEMNKPKLTLELLCTGKIKFAQTKGILTEKKIINENTIIFNLSESIVKNDQNKMNLQFIYSYEGMFDPQVILGSTMMNNHAAQNNKIQEKRQSALVSFIPNFNSEISQEIDDSMQAALNDGNDYLSDEFQQKINQELIDHSESSRSEFIFLLDRSGSMNGRPIKKATEALNLFLKSLPPNSYFNVYSFGTRYVPMFPNSVQYTGKSLEIALKKVKNFKANLGRTDILSPLTNIFEVQEKINGYNKQIFLLTDGGVKNRDKVIRLIKKNNKNSRINSIGFGSGADQHLINTSAIAGKGISKIIDMEEDLSEVVIEMLGNCITPSLDDFSISYDTSVVESTFPASTNFPSVFKDDIINIHFFFKPKIEISNLTESQRLVKIQYYDSKQKQQIQKEIKLDVPDAFISNESLQESIFKLGKNMQLNEIFVCEEEDNENRYLQQALDYQLLTEKTALICVIQEANDAQKVQIQTQQNQIEEKKGFLKSLQKQYKPGKPSLDQKDKIFSKLKRGRDIKISQPKMKMCAKKKVKGVDEEFEKEFEEDFDYDKPRKRKSETKSIKIEQKIVSKLKNNQENNENILCSNQIFEEILNLVDHLGIWKYEKNLIDKYLSNKKDGNKKFEDLSFNFTNKDALMTLFILCILELFQTHNKSKWILIFKKSLAFVKKNIKQNKKIEDIQESLKQIIQ
ncbi:type A von willebrand factor domain protein (macronuclear) [Tetrahymena thermophila SB210]|uniref:Type A von willebrand factor domain protein n=1 Tax=Tetrahymena thermophila (strain SB210) TaxID=312017 RepID=Q24CQ9_TETTS|nr:type A von willebrand factor domain protein [Tetrahymena thermophila SB210]EAS05567.1 type A von willebrand factor domain protein [Tetrahymena thermophila SB210]|eukprot:XP_001025812.1 type A von willebrand factor domain protein [Tetrahymena thermophila SB210]